jgi:hypothetical protein
VIWEIPGVCESALHSTNLLPCNPPISCTPFVHYWSQAPNQRPLLAVRTKYVCFDRTSCDGIRLGLSESPEHLQLADGEAKQLTVTLSPPSSVLEDFGAEGQLYMPVKGPIFAQERPEQTGSVYHCCPGSCQAETRR